MPTATEIRERIVAQYADELARRGMTASEVPLDFDLLTEGLVDSLGVLELVGVLEEAFQLEVDLADLDAEQLTVIGPLSEYVAARGVPRVSAARVD